MTIQPIKNSFIIVILVTVFTSCNQNATLQTYFVDHELNPGFSTFDVPSNVIDVQHLNLNNEQKEAYESVKKLNVLMYRLNDSVSQEEFKLELNKVKSILKNPKYEELMRGGNNTHGKFSVNFVGDINNIDELVIFGSANNKGFVIARVLGNNMNAQKLMSLQTVIKNADINDGQLKTIKSFF